MFRTILLYIPLSIIGAWRWSYWLVRVIGATIYRRRVRKTILPLAENVKLTLSVVTPVYNENEALFDQALESWIANGVNEIIAVIDKTNTRLIVKFERLYSPRKDVKCRLVVTPKAGKRAALADGIEHAKSDLVALVDSDTVWGDTVRQQVIPYFADPKMGGVTVSQRIMNPDTISNVLFDILLWNRYHEEVPFLLGLGKAYNTLSGRTAIYRRAALVNDKYDNVHDLTHEFFFNTRAVSGDDKRLSHLILAQGWRVAFAQKAVVYTQGLSRMRHFLKQRLRWTRNSWRADLRAVKSGWIFRYPVLAYFVIDRFVQPFFMLLGPVAATIGAIERRWSFVEVLVGWWLVSRTVRLFGYFRHYPKRLIYLPAYIIYSYTNAALKIYALATILENSWATRWHKSRLRRRLIRRWATVLVGLLALGGVILLVVGIVQHINRETGVTIPVPAPVLSSSEFAVPENSTTANVPAVPPLPPNALLPSAVKTYTVQEGDNLATLAQRFNMNLETLKKLNNIVNPDKISPNTVILYYATSSNPVGGTP
jgi:glycosyltransferase involved in cell wall biosynthesis/LysM repeat protein